MLKKCNNNYYAKMRGVSELIFERYNLIDFVEYKGENEKELLKQIYLDKLYNILLDIVNQVVYDEINEFSSEDMEFIIDFNIDKILPDIIRIIHENINIKKLKKEIKKSKKIKNKVLKSYNSQLL